MSDQVGEIITSLKVAVGRDASGFKQKAILAWSIRILDAEPGMELEVYLSLVDHEWPKSVEYRNLQWDLAYKTLDEMEKEIADEEVRPTDEPGGQDDPEVGMGALWKYPRL